MSTLDYITINGSQVYRPPQFLPKREDIYKGDYMTCTGKTIADRVGWKYSDMTLKWTALPQSMVNTLISMSGICSLVFDDLDGVIHTEEVVRLSAVAVRHRYTQNGVVYWKNVEVQIRFIGSHTGPEGATGATGG